MTDPWWQVVVAVLAGLLLVWLASLVALAVAARRGPDRIAMSDLLRLLPDVVRLVGRLAGDRSLPRGVRWRLWLLLGYLVLPVDLVPDFLPVIGYADDAIVIALVLRSVVRVAGPGALDRHWPGSPAGLAAVRRLVGHDGGVTEFPQLLHTAIDTTDVRGLAEFYRELLGLRYRPGDETPEEGEDWLVLTDQDGHRVLAFQLVPELAPTTWPTHEVPMQLHVDFTVTSRESLEETRRRAEALGATILLDRTDEEGEPLYVFGDPSGHPFCVFVA
ncbi:VOC family protein [Nocardioides mangrovi]|uniref:DUF1232 domain-containing protein n=1 Tax=Nocardioides mangrovi TaxID=2874580 RepID=A0ABS7UHQ5_9ACTN|nr:VOC family protein [Nocardioides mangrovi]MBZ5740558.1 DUF1232 domain-containing protein [Nocardioides mangrovi]